jgi:hypothetical protein
MTLAMTGMIAKFIVTKLPPIGGYAAALPGGIHKAPAPRGTAYPFLTFEHVQGSATLVMNGGRAVGGNFLFLLKVTDNSESQLKAQEGAEWVNAALAAIGGAPIDGGYVYVQEGKPYDFSPVEQDVRYHQIGDTYTFYVDRGI